MARVYVHIPFTDHDGEHPVNQELTLPRENDEEKANYDRLIDYGIVGTSPLDTSPETKAKDEKTS